MPEKKETVPVCPNCRIKMRKKTVVRRFKI